MPVCGCGYVHQCMCPLQNFLPAYSYPCCVHISPVVEPILTVQNVLLRPLQLREMRALVRSALQARGVLPPAAPVHHYVQPMSRGSAASDPGPSAPPLAHSVPTNLDIESAK